LKTGHSRDKTPQEGSVGQNGGITKALLDHASAPTDLASWLEHEKVEPPPTHPRRASIRNRRAPQGKGGSMDTSSIIEESAVAVCGATFGEEIIRSLERTEDDDMVSQHVGIDDIAWIERVRDVPWLEKKKN